MSSIGSSDRATPNGAQPTALQRQEYEFRIGSVGVRPLSYAARRLFRHPVGVYCLHPLPGVAL